MKLTIAAAVAASSLLLPTSTYASNADTRNLRADDTPPSSSSSTTTITSNRPNVIIMQPDDLHFYDIWNPPPNNPDNPNQSHDTSSYGLPNIESLRLNGIQMMEAYTTSAMCGTSRFSTMTSRYPSRAVSNDKDGRKHVVIPNTKLESQDCTKENIAVQFRDNGYRTAMFGKWHLTEIDKDTYTYENAVSSVKECGFDIVGGLYIENLWVVDEHFMGTYNDGSFSHNMEWVTSEAVKVIQEKSEDPFFMYFNPTVPHSDISVEGALKDFSCRDTPAGKLSSDLDIPGMTEEYGGDCDAYRKSIYDRAEDYNDLGAIWVDDSVGVLLRALKDQDILDNTIFVFQADHGMNSKSSLYEGGVRIPQFVHYPNKISAGMKFDSPISVIDTSATVLDYAGITPSYDIDGQSWKEVIVDGSEPWKNRCLFFEMSYDRAVRCGCYKYLEIYNSRYSNTFRKGGVSGLSHDGQNLFNLCGNSDSYVTEIKGDNMEARNLFDESPIIVSQLETIQRCHLKRISNGEFSSCQLDDQNDANDESPTTEVKDDSQEEPEDPEESEALLDLLVYLFGKNSGSRRHLSGSQE